MKTSIMIAVAILAAMSSQSASADCPEAATSGSQQQAGIAKDGTHAPMEDKASAQSQPGPAEGTTTANSQSAAQLPRKDGSSIPMNENRDIATSGQDVQAQQKGDKTAAAIANDKKC